MSNILSVSISLLNFSFICLLICIENVWESTATTTFDRKEEKLVLKPIELIDLILEEHRRPEITLIEKENQETDGEFGNRRYREQKLTTKPNVNRVLDAKVLSRKVWSRWSKWGQCSATCGSGAKVRHRVCLAGRCAPGEREEQRRPCCRQPCEAS